MIQKDLAKRLADGVSPFVLREAFLAAILEGVAIPPFSGLGDDPPEDVFAALLATSPQAQSMLLPEQREALIDACTREYQKIFIFLTKLEAVELGTDTAREAQIAAFVRFCRLIDLSACEELAGFAITAFRKAVTGLKGNESAETQEKRIFYGALVRAAAAFQQSEVDAKLWMMALHHDVFSAYAFNALLGIDPYNFRIKEAYKALWVRAIDGADLNILFLSNRLIKAQNGSKEHCFDVLRDLYSEGRQEAIEPLLMKSSFGRALHNELGKCSSTRLRSLTRSSDYSKPATLILQKLIGEKLLSYSLPQQGQPREMMPIVPLSYYYVDDSIPSSSTEIQEIIYRLNDKISLGSIVRSAKMSEMHDTPASVVESEQTLRFPQYFPNPSAKIAGDRRHLHFAKNISIFEWEDDFRKNSVSDIRKWTETMSHRVIGLPMAFSNAVKTSGVESEQEGFDGRFSLSRTL